MAFLASLLGGTGGAAGAAGAAGTAGAASPTLLGALGTSLGSQGGALGTAGNILSFTNKLQEANKQLGGDQPTFNPYKGYEGWQGGAQATVDLNSGSPANSFFSNMIKNAQNKKEVADYKSQQQIAQAMNIPEYPTSQAGWANSIYGDKSPYQSIQTSPFQPSSIIPNYSTMPEYPIKPSAPAWSSIF